MYVCGVPGTYLPTWYCCMYARGVHVHLRCMIYLFRYDSTKYQTVLNWVSRAQTVRSNSRQKTEQHRVATCIAVVAVLLCTLLIVVAQLCGPSILPVWVSRQYRHDSGNRH